MAVPPERFSPGKQPGETPGICKAKQDGFVPTSNDNHAIGSEIWPCFKGFSDSAQRPATVQQLPDRLSDAHHFPGAGEIRGRALPAKTRDQMRILPDTIARIVPIQTAVSSFNTGHSPALTMPRQ